MPQMPEPGTLQTISEFGQFCRQSTGSGPISQSYHVVANFAVRRPGSYTANSYNSIRFLPSTLTASNNTTLPQSVIGAIYSIETGVLLASTMEINSLHLQTVVVLRSGCADDMKSFDGSFEFQLSRTTRCSAY